MVTNAGWQPDDPVDATALAWLRERPGTPVDGIGIVTRIWRLAKLFGEDRRRVLAAENADPATLDLLSVLRRAGPPYALTTRELADRTRVTAGAISQRLTRAEDQGLVVRQRATGSRRVTVTLTDAGHALVERLVDRVLGREADLVAALDPDRRAQLTELLRTLLTDLDARLDHPPHSGVGSD
ncbi:MarR family winged helix-turn-helix transcriptional regulator [Pseudonocardia acaciae]|uniref:MarR family winged helix-turn-helix transcriptional regulator n=1 Tax=Pseudonocardia acaciae TaxID=551276 RepID=UPI00056D3654|nr:MarR family transcriptional regulator [Pseudonocardia acaciae]